MRTISSTAYLFMSTFGVRSIPLLLLLHHYQDYFREYAIQKDFMVQQKSNQVYDFIVVGAGSSGCVVTHRLIKAGYSVLLLEAGGIPLPLLDIPNMFTPIQESKFMNYAYETEPQVNFSLATPNNRVYYPSGKMLGGTSNILASIFTKGHTKDYDKWAELTNDSDWNAASLEKHFNKVLELISVAREDPSPIGNVLLDSARESGYPIVDFNKPYGKGGFQHFTLTKKPGNSRRSGSFQDYLRPILNDPLLTVKKFAVVSRILFSEEKEAIGVEYTQFDQKHTAKVAKEIILCAGAFESPKILMLSGIGPKAHLQDFNIPIVVDVPGVGSNLQDHVFVVTNPIIIRDPLTANFNNGNSFFQSVTDYFGAGEGFFAGNIYRSAAFLTTSIAEENGEGDWPDLEMQVSELSMGDINMALSVETRARFKPGFTHKSYSYAYGHYSFMFISQVVRPKSRGYVKLRTANINDHPIIDMKYFDHPDDVKVVIEGFKIADKMMNETKAFRSIGVNLDNYRAVEGCRHHKLFTTEYYDCHARTMPVAGCHGSGTCKMGAKNDPTAVVDTRLRVIGTKRLRIMDASIFPLLPNAHSFWPVLMVGEKGAQMILEDLIENQDNFI